MTFFILGRNRYCWKSTKTWNWNRISWTTPSKIGIFFVFNSFL